MSRQVLVPAGGLLSRDRQTVVTVTLLAVIAALGLLGLCYGADWATPAEAISALFGYGDSVVVIAQWRFPRVLAGIVFGAALGIAGALFQNLTRNPLGSPDIIGLDQGAYTGALVALTVLSGTSAQLTGFSVLGGLAAATVIYLLSVNGGLSGLRLVVIGIAVNAVLTAVNSWIVLRAELEVAIAAVGWSSGSLNGISFSDIALPFVVIGMLLAVMALQARAVQQAALGDALATTTGVHVERLRLLMVFVGVGCTATVTAVCGPIAFIALAAPQIGRRLAKAPGVPLLPAALTGAMLLLAADLIAQMLLAPVSLPVGVVSTAIGGAYLIWLLAKEVRKG